MRSVWLHLLYANNNASLLVHQPDISNHFLLLTQMMTIIFFISLFCYSPIVTEVIHWFTIYSELYINSIQHKFTSVFDVINTIIASLRIELMLYLHISLYIYLFWLFWIIYDFNEWWELILNARISQGRI